jgi:hypothetical protein
MLEFLLGGFSGESDFEDSKESFLMDGEQSLFGWFIDINNFLFSDMNNLVKAFYLSPDDFCNPKCLIHEAFSDFDGNKVLSFTKEESESSCYIFA